MLGDTIETVEKHYMPFVREFASASKNSGERRRLEEVAALAPEASSSRTEETKLGAPAPTPSGLMIYLGVFAMASPVDH